MQFLGDILSLPAARGSSQWGQVGLWDRCRTLGATLARGFSIDLRSLAVFRVALALLLLWDLQIAAGDVKAFYSDAGVLPRSYLLSSPLWESDLWCSLHLMSGSAWVQGALMLLAALVALMLLVGWRTRLATVVSWVLLCSLQCRNPVILHSGDAVVRLSLFWSIFLPLGARWSVDARLSRGRPRGDELVSIAGTCLLLQIAMIYWFTVWLRTDPMWHETGTALRVALQLDLFVKPAGVWLRDHPDMCRVLTHGTMIAELWVPLLAFLPFARTCLRLSAVLIFLALHLGIWICMDVGPFSYVMAAAWLVFLPSAAWDWLACRMQAMATRLPRLRYATIRSVAKIVHWVRRGPERVFRRHASSRYGLRPSIPAQAFLLVCLAYIVSWNVRGTNFPRHEKWFPQRVNEFGHALRLEQYWGMFAPCPLTEDGWFVCIGRCANGKDVDLLRHGAPTDWAKPALGIDRFDDSRWQKYLNNLWDKGYSRYRDGLMHYLTVEWNRSHPGGEQLLSAELWFVREPTERDGTVTGKTERVKLYGADVPWDLK